MIRLTLTLPLLGILTLLQVANGQCVVSQDSVTRQVITTCQFYATNGPLTAGMPLTPPRSQQTYLGSEYFTFPIWQAGRVQLDQLGQQITCQLAYNLKTNEVRCKLDENSAGKLISPVEFTINNVKFVRRTIKAGGVSINAYCTVLYNGQTQLLMTMSRFLNTGQASDGYAKAGSFNGIYRTKTSYYIQKGNARPELISLSKSAVLATLYEQADKLTERLPNEKLTTDEVIETLRQYDSLMLANAANKPALSGDALFNQELRNRIQYPALAWREGIYSRVYAGFEVNTLGQITNVTILSPDNGGFGFEQEVKQALKKLPLLKPAYSGTYALPVAFIFTNQAGSQAPINTLTAERLVDRTVLEEIKISFSVSKSAVSSREVWGYYK